MLIDDVRLSVPKVKVPVEITFLSKAFGIYTCLVHLVRYFPWSSSLDAFHTDARLETLTSLEYTARQPVQLILRQTQSAYARSKNRRISAMPKGQQSEPTLLSKLITSCHTQAPKLRYK